MSFFWHQNMVILTELYLNEPFRLIISADGCGKEDATQENEETTHKAEVQGRSHFVSEVMGEKISLTGKHGFCVFSHSATIRGGTHYLIRKGSALLCKTAATTLFMYKQYPARSVTPAQDKEADDEEEERKPDRPVAGCSATHSPAGGQQWPSSTCHVCSSDLHQRRCTLVQKKPAPWPVTWDRDLSPAGPWLPGYRLVTNTCTCLKCMKDCSLKSKVLWHLKVAYIWQSTALQSRCSSPEPQSLHSSPATGWTSTRLSPPQQNPLCLPAGPPSSHLTPTNVFKISHLPFIHCEDIRYHIISNYLPLKYCT